MKPKESVKLINVTKNKEKSTLRRIITEKISRIVSAAHNNT